MTDVSYPDYPEWRVVKMAGEDIWTITLDWSIPGAPAANVAFTLDSTEAAKLRDALTEALA